MPGPGNLKNSIPCVSYCLKSSLAFIPWENRHLWRAVYALAVGHLVFWGLEMFCGVAVRRCENFGGEPELKQPKIVESFQIFLQESFKCLLPRALSNQTYGCTVLCKMPRQSCTFCVLLFRLCLPIPPKMQH